MSALLLNNEPWRNDSGFGKRGNQSGIEDKYGPNQGPHLTGDCDYLGISDAADGNTQLDVLRHIKSAKAVFAVSYKICSCNYNKIIKLRMSPANVLPVLLYGRNA